MTYKFRFFIRGKFLFARQYEASCITVAWKMAKAEANEYPTNQFIEIANI